VYSFSFWSSNYDWQSFIPPENFSYCLAIFRLAWQSFYSLDELSSFAYKMFMRIGMMADVYKPHVSGVTNYIALNKAHLEKMGHQVFVFTFGAGDYIDDEINIVRSPSRPLLDTGYYFSLRYTRSARRLLQTMDVVHVHHPFLSGTLALLYCRQRGIPLIFTNHTRYDLYAQAYLPIMPDVVGNAALQSYMPAFCRSCDMVVSPSPGMRDILEQFGVDVPIEVVPNGVDLKPFQNPGHPMDRLEMGFASGDVILLFVGRMGPEKNLDWRRARARKPRRLGEPHWQPACRTLPRAGRL
jgi:1,2-diacylglycerol 3-alpha-glucosyltransferase